LQLALVVQCGAVADCRGDVVELVDACCWPSVEAGDGWEWLYLRVLKRRGGGTGEESCHAES